LVNTYKGDILVPIVGLIQMRKNILKSTTLSLLNVTTKEINELPFPILIQYLPNT
jgi:hypothetical protein